AGADCVKILLYYTPYDPKDVNDKKHAWVERIGDECRANDIPFFLEYVGYEEGADEKGLDYAKKKPHIVTESMREFSKDRYGVDVLKVEVPVNMKFVEGMKSFAGQKAYTKQEAIDRKSTRLNSSHGSISYAVFCLKKKKNKNNKIIHTTNQK